MNSSSKTKASVTDGRQAAEAPSLTRTISAYYRLTKPGIIYGNSLTTAAGFLFAAGMAGSPGVSWGTFVATLVGSGLVIACGCVLNNYIDRPIDARMRRTRGRPLISGEVSVAGAMVLAAVTGSAGLILLLAFTNLVTVYVGLLGLYTYVVAYGYAKRRSPWGTLVGSIPGATPIVAGYTAVAGRTDLTALALFIIMAAWQIPHFYAIAIYRLKDYQAAGIPVFAAVKGIAATKRHIIGSIIVFIATLGGLYLLGPVSATGLIVTTAVSIMWLHKAIRGLNAKEGKPTDTWARGVFGLSLLVLMTLSATLALDRFLP